MDLDFDSNSDSQSLSGVTLAEEPELYEERDELLGVGSNFHWRMRMSTPTKHRFGLRPPTRNSEVIAKLSCRRLPRTIDGFRNFLDSCCPNDEGKAFKLRCSVWPTSPYGLVPVQFAGDLCFGASRTEETSDISDLENANYQSLIGGCREFAAYRPGREVEFEVKIIFAKEFDVV